ncbi:MAG: TetR/AcrR family transcriptional regulator [Clostridiales bacterium]|nr:TetR/AcrR family transcriptional regulator [Clostridiales bacterium]
MSDRKERKRELILGTAFKLILEKGFANTKIIDIANSAGIGKGTLYEYFDSKEALILELINTKVRRDYEKVCEAMEEASSCKQKLSRYLRYEIETTAKYRANVIDFKNEITSNSDEISAEILNAVHTIIFNQFQAVYNVVLQGIEAGEFRAADPLMAAACFMGSVSFYLSLLGGGMFCPDADGFGGIAFQKKEDAFLDCIFNGLIA